MSTIVSNDARSVFSVIPWAQLGGGHERRVPSTFSDSGDIICHIPPFFSLGFVIYWFQSKLSPSHFTTKLRSCVIAIGVLVATVVVS